MTIACQPNACQRARYVSMSCPSSVARLCPSALMSTIAQSASSLWRCATRRGFPHRAFGRLAVAHQAVGAIVRADAAGVQRGADRRAQALAERPGRHVHERQPRRGVAFEIRGEQPQVGELLARDEARLRPHRVQQRRRVPLRHHQAVGQRDAAGRRGRSASRRRTAPPSSPPPTCRWSGGHWRRPWWRGWTRCGAGWRCF